MDSKKKDSIYRDKVHEIMTAGSTEEYARRVRISGWYDMYYNKYTNDRYSKLLARHEFEQKESEKAAVKGVTPFVRMNLDSISPKIKLILGDLEARGFEPKVRAKNKGAYKRKKAYRKVIEYLAEMQPYFEQLAEQTQMPLGINPNLPKNEEELNLLMKEYRDVYEILMESAMTDVLDKEHYNLGRQALMTDLMITNEVHAVPEMVDGKVTYRRINPLNIIPDLSSTKALMNDKTFACEAYYMPVQQVLQEYGIAKEDMNGLMERYRAGEFTGWWTQSQNAGKALEPFFNVPGAPGFESTGYNRVLVIKAQWLDIETHVTKSTYDKYDNLHVHTYKAKGEKLSNKEAKDPRNEIIEKPIAEVKYCVLVAGDIVADCGVKKNTIRSVESPQDTGIDYVSMVADYNNLESVSMVDRLGPLQDFKNYVMTLLQKQITNNFGNYTEVDLALIDNATYGADAHTIKRVLLALTASNIIITNSAKDKGGYTPNTGHKKAVTAHDSPLMNVIQSFTGILGYLDQQIDMVSGMNEARQGQSGERSLVGTTQMKMVQSSLMTEVYFSHFFVWEKEFLKKLCYHIAMDWVDNPEKYEHIADMHNIAIPEGFSIDMEDWSIEIDQRPMTRDTLNRAMEYALAQGNLTPEDFMLISMITQNSIKEGIKEYINISKQRRQEAAAAAQAERQFEAEQKELDRQANQSKDIGKAQVNAQAVEGAARTKAGVDRYKADMGAELQQEQINSQEFQKTLEAYGGAN